MLLDELLQSIQPAMSNIGQGVSNGMNALMNMGNAPTGMTPAPQPQGPQQESTGPLGFLDKMDPEKMGMLGMALMSAGRGGNGLGAMLPLLGMLSNRGGAGGEITPTAGDATNLPLMTRGAGGAGAIGRQPGMTRAPMQVPTNQPDNGLYSPNMQQLTGGTPVDKLMNAISSVESGGRYDAMGPRTKSGDRAYGRYQVMGNNIPGWTKNALGESLTPDQFLNNPQAQDSVARHYLGQYLDKYGNPQDAASMWFSGRPARNNNSRDILGTSVPQYVNRVTRHLQRY